MLQITPWSIPSLIALLLALATLVRIRQSERMPGAIALGAACIGAMFWAMGQLITTLTTDLDLKILAAQLQYPGIALLPAAWFMFAVDYLRRQHHMAPSRLALLLAVPLTTVALAWTNPFHELIWKAITLSAIDGFVGVTFVYGGWFGVHLVYSYALVLAATVILRFELAGSLRYAQARTAVVAAPLAVVAVNVIYLSPWNPLPFIDPSPLGLAVALWIMNRGVLRTGFLELSPQLHRRVVEELRDPIVVLDTAGFIVEANPAARRKLDDGRRLVGREVADVLPLAPMHALLIGRATSAEVALRDRTWHVRATLLHADGHSGRNLVLVLRDITERLAAENELLRVKLEMERLAHTDPLTGLANRRFFMQRLLEEIERTRRHGHPLSVMLLDLDLFKQVNDTHGHDTGDRVLVGIASTIQRLKRSSDVAARFGGEEFALLLPETDREGAARLADRMRRGIAETRTVHANGSPVTVTTSIGIATIHREGSGLDDLLVRADRALYRAKHAGRDRIFAALD